MRCRPNIKDSLEPSPYQTMILSARLTKNATGQALQNSGKNFPPPEICIRENIRASIVLAARHLRSQAIFLSTLENYGVPTTRENRKRWRRKTGFSDFQNTKKNFCKLSAETFCVLSRKHAKTKC